jgi:hypothetical protein
MLLLFLAVLVVVLVVVVVMTVLRIIVAVAVGKKKVFSDTSNEMEKYNEKQIHVPYAKLYEPKDSKKNRYGTKYWYK